MLHFTMPNLIGPHFTATSPFSTPLPFLSLLHEIIPKYTGAKSGKWISWGKDDLLTCLSDRSQLQADRNYWRHVPLIWIPIHKRGSLRERYDSRLPKRDRQWDRDYFWLSQQQFARLKPLLPTDTREEGLALITAG